VGSTGCAGFLCPAPRGEGPPSGPAPGFLEAYAATHRFRLGHPTNIHPSPDGERVLFLRSGPRDLVRKLYLQEVASGEERVFATAEALLGGGAETLSPGERARRERLRLTASGIAEILPNHAGTEVLVPLSGRLFLIDVAHGEAREMRGAEAPAGYPAWSPDDAWVAYLRGGDLHVQSTALDGERRLTQHQGDDLSYGLPEFVAEEEMGRHEGFWWSPDSTEIATQRTDTSGLERMTIADPTRPEAAPQSWPYPRAGKQNASVRLFIQAIDAPGMPAREVVWDHTAFPYLARVVWQAGSPLTLLIQDREQTEARVLAVDTSTGETRLVHRERDAAWLNLWEQVPAWVGPDLVWVSEAGGHAQLMRMSAQATAPIPVTPPELGLRAVLGVDPKQAVVWLAAAADPTQEQVVRVRLDGGRPEPLAVEPGVSSAAIEPGSPIWVRTLEPLEGPRRSSVYRVSDGAFLGGLKSVAEALPFTPRLELTTVTAGGRDHHVAVVWPRVLQDAARLPVIELIYGGPGVQVVQAAGARYLLAQWMADHGYAVVQIDGRGTPGRGRDWERAIQGDLASLVLEDHVAVLRALGARYPSLDTNRVGVFGWSFGGYLSAMAVLRHPDVYRAAVAGAPVTDWLDYDTHYTERFMGLPDKNPEGYRRASALTHAPGLSRPLLLIHGTADDNVYLTHTLKLADALNNTERSFDFMPLPGSTHMVTDPALVRVVHGRIMAFFASHLQ
jgi:dipeptidyl-peptidase-4